MENVLHVPQQADEILKFLLENLYAYTLKNLETSWWSWKYILITVI